MKRISAIAAVMATAVFFSACGSSGDETTNEVKKATYVKQANQLCSSVAERYSEEVASLVEEKKQTETKIVANRELLMRRVVLPLLREASSEFETLGTPEGGWTGDTTLGEALEKAADEFEDEPGAITAGPNSPLREFSEIAEQVGAENCSTAI
jgi:hypothetical protein